MNWLKKNIFYTKKTIFLWLVFFCIVSVVNFMSCDNQTSPIKSSSSTLLATASSASSSTKIETFLIEPPATIGGTATITWNALTIAGTSYDVYLDQTTTPATKIASGLKNLNYSATELKPNKTYYWKIVAVAPNTPVIESSVKNFKTANASVTSPLQNSPTNEATNISTTSNLQWIGSTSSDNSPVTYDIYLDKNSNPITKIASGIATTNYTVTALSSSQIYYWKIVAKNSLNFMSENNDVRKFTTGNFTVAATNIGAPLLIAPEQDAKNQSTIIALSWNTAISPDNSKMVYDVYVDQSPNPITKVASTLTNTYYTISGLSDGTIKYYWKVIARNASNISFESAVRNFSTSPQVNPFALSSPANNSSVQAYSVQLLWNTTTCTDGSTIVYDVYVDKNENPTTLVFGGLMNPTFSPTNISLSTTYYWKVIARSSSRKQTTSSVFKFTTSNQEFIRLTAPTLIFPSNNQSDIIATPTLQWNASAGSGTILYDVYIDKNTTPTTIVASNLTSTSHTPSLRFENTFSNTYYWKIVAKDNSGNQLSSEVFKYTSLPEDMIQIYDAVPNSGDESLRLKTALGANQFRPTGFFIYQGKSFAIDVTWLKGSHTLPRLIIGTYRRSTGQWWPQFVNLTEGVNTVTGSLIDDIPNQVHSIYIDYTNSTADMNSNRGQFKFRFISGMQRIPYFKLFKHSDATYSEMLTKIPSDYNETILEGKRCYFILNRSDVETNIKNTTMKVSDLVKLGDRIIQAEDSISGLTVDSPDPIDKVTLLKYPLVQGYNGSSGGYMYAAWTYSVYPNSTGAGPTTTSVDGIGWGHWHELGHLHQTGYLTSWAGTEVTVNIYSLAVQKTLEGKVTRLSGMNLWSGLQPWFAIDFNSKSYFDHDVWQRLAIFYQLMATFGDSFMQDLHKRQRRITQDLNNDDRIRWFMVNSSDIARKNLTDFFRKWGLKLSTTTATDAAYQAVRDLNYPAPDFDVTTVRDNQ